MSDPFAKVEASRRKFVKQLAGGAFVAPTLLSFPPTAAAQGTTPTPDSDDHPPPHHLLDDHPNADTDGHANDAHADADADAGPDADAHSDAQSEPESQSDTEPVADAHSDADAAPDAESESDPSPATPCLSLSAMSSRCTWGLRQEVAGGGARRLNH